VESRSEEETVMSRNVVIIIVALIVIGCGLVTLVGGVALVAFGLFPQATSGRTGLSSVSEGMTRTFDVATPARLIVQQDNGQVEIRSGDGSRIQVQATKRASGANAEELLRNLEVEITQDGNTVRVVTRRQRTAITFGGASVDYDITVPVQTDVEVTASNGVVSVAGVTGDVTARTDNGRIDVDKAQGAISVQTDNGRIRIQNTQASPLQAQSHNGSIEFDESLGSQGDSHVETDNGSIQLTLARDDRLRIDVRTDNGAISSNLPLTDEVKTQRSLTGILNSPAATLTIKTNNGSVTLEAR
jgi:DUF4097 and DUF4098 domain-containing protein YvlB